MADQRCPSWAAAHIGTHLRGRRLVSRLHYSPAVCVEPSTSVQATQDNACYIRHRCRCVGEQTAHGALRAHFRLGRAGLEDRANLREGVGVSSNEGASPVLCVCIMRDS